MDDSRRRSRSEAKRTGAGCHGTLPREECGPVKDRHRALFPWPPRPDKLPDMDVMQYASGDTPGEARAAGETGGGIATLAAGKLYALQHSYALDGRVSFYPASARGFSVANSYLLKEPDAAMLIDTGFGKDEPAIRAEVESLIAPGQPLSMFPLRLNEFMSINNVESFAGHFNVETCYTSNIDAALWFDFGAKAEGRDTLKSMKVTAVSRADTIALGKGGRLIDVMNAPIRLIATRWLYDHATKTLFSSDLFSPTSGARPRAGPGSSPRPTTI